MSTRPFSLFVNRFEVATRDSYNVAIAVGTQHVNSLFADSTTSPIALTCYNNVKPKFDIFKAARIAHSSQTGTQSGDVLSFKQMLKTMPVVVDAWQTQIKAVYPEGSIRFKALFPKGKKTLNEGKQQNRVDAVATLITTIGTDASLAAVKIVIQTFETALLLAFGTKDDAKADTITDSTELETARVNLCIEIEGNYGLLINFYKAEPTLAAKYFDEALMRKILQMIFATTIGLLKTKNLFKRTFANPLTQQLQITNNTNTILYMFLSVTKKGQVGLVYVTIAPLSVSTHNLTEFGDPATAIYFNIYNTNINVKAQVSVKIL